MEKQIRKKHLATRGKRWLALLLSVCLIGTLIPVSAKAADSTTTVGNFTVTGDTSKYTYADNTLTITDYGTFTISGSTTKDRIVVGNGSATITANITLNGVNIDGSGTSPGFCAFLITKCATVKLTIKGENTLKSGSSYAGLQVEGKALSIKEESQNNPGSLSVIGGDNGAGIGGGSGKAGGTITISGGKVNANGGSKGAGIGGGSGKAGGTITISGGEVNANGGSKGAGIGGGSNGDGGTITISGGKVNANGGSNGAGIGGGNCGKGGTIAISGGEVEAKGGNLGAGIGGGNNEPSGKITISGGEVEAKGGGSAAGIGGGNCGSGTGGSIIISAGEVTAYSESNYSIGKSSNSDNSVPFSTGDSGSAVIICKAGSGGTAGISDVSKQDQWNCIVYNDTTKTGTVYGNVTLSGNLEISEGYTLTIPAGAGLTIPDEKTLTNNGTIIISGSEEEKDCGKLTNKGTIQNNGSIINKGIIEKQNGTIQNATSGTIVTLEGGQVKAPSLTTVPTNPAWNSTTPGKATWSGVNDENASGYKVALYKDDVLVVSDLFTESTEYDLTNYITTGGSYTFKVKTVGDGANYLDSEESVSSSAQIYYTVVFNTKGAGTIDMQAVIKNGKVTEPTTPTKTDYIFDGWYSTDTYSASTKWDFTNDTVSENTTLYAKWISKVAGVTKVSVNGIAGIADGEEISVVLPYGSTISNSLNVVVTTVTGAVYSQPVSTNNGSTWTFTVTAEDGSTTKNYTVNVSVAENPAAGNQTDVDATKSVIENHNWTVTQATANSTDSIKLWVEQQLAGMDLNGATYTVNISDGFTAAIAGTESNQAGTNGSFDFTVSLSKGENTGDIATCTYATATASVKGGKITATVYTGGGSIDIPSIPSEPTEPTGPETPSDPTVPGETDTSEEPRKPETPSDSDTSKVTAPKRGTLLTDSETKMVYKVTKSGINGGTVQFVTTKNTKEKTVAIPDKVTIDGITYKVTSIAANALKNNETVTKVTIGKYVTSIGSKAFYQCKQLTSITIPSKVKKIGKYILMGCSKLKSIKINSTLLSEKTVSNQAFSGIPAKVKIKVPKSKEKAYKNLFVKKD